MNYDHKHCALYHAQLATDLHDVTQTVHQVNLQSNSIVNTAAAKAANIPSTRQSVTDPCILADFPGSILQQNKLCTKDTRRVSADH